MGTPISDWQLRDALDSAADAFWEDGGAAPTDGGHRRRRVRIGMAVGAAALVVGAALVVAALGASTTGGGPRLRAARGPATATAPRSSSVKGTVHAPSAGGGFAVSTAPAAVQGAAGTGGGSTVPSSKSSASSSAAPSSAASPSSVPSLPSGIVGQSAKVEMNGSADVTVRRGSLSVALATLTNMAVGSGGYVASSSVQTGSPSPVPLPVPQAQSTSSTVDPVPTSPSASVTLEIPTGAYQGVVNRLGTVGTVTSLNTRADDVTGQYTDLQARITALEASRQQYLTIMTQATSISDILAVQNDIDQLQSQIEQLQGQLNLLNSQTTYGSLAVAVAEGGVRPTPPPPVHVGGSSSAWHGAVHGFLAGVNGIIRISGPLLFVLLCLAALVLLTVSTWRMLRRRQRAGAPST